MLIHVLAQPEALIYYNILFTLIFFVLSSHRLIREYPGECLLLVGETKVDAEGRVDVSLKLALAGKVIGVVIEDLHIIGVQHDNLLVGGDALGGNRLGQDGGASCN